MVLRDFVNGNLVSASHGYCLSLSQFFFNIFTVIDCVTSCEDSLNFLEPSRFLILVQEFCNYKLNGSLAILVTLLWLIFLNQVAGFTSQNPWIILNVWIMSARSRLKWKQIQLIQFLLIWIEIESRSTLLYTTITVQCTMYSPGLVGDRKWDKRKNLFAPRFQIYLENIVCVFNDDGNEETP